MAVDWQEELTDLRGRLETTLRQNAERDHYYPGIVVIDGEPSEEIDRVTPGIYAGGWRIAERYTVRLPQGGFHLHFIFDNNPDESDHHVLSLLREELRRIPRILQSVPKRVVPAISIPPHQNGLVESMLHWLHLVHWLGTQPDNSVFRTHFQFVQSVNDYVTGASFRPWNECSTVPEFEPIALSTLTTPEDKGIQYWKSQHQAVNKVLPQVIASSLSKPLLYASVNAVDLVLDRAEGGKPRRNRRPDRFDDKKLSNDAELLLDFLLAHHKCNSDEPCYSSAGTQDEIAAKLSQCVGGKTQDAAWNQTRVSHAFEELFQHVEAYSHVKPKPRYERLCQDEEICRVLLVLWLKIHEKGVRREFGVKNIDGFADQGFKPAE
ncbi:MAG: hypothetical protein ACUVQH_05190 [Thermogutta sp.]